MIYDLAVRKLSYQYFTEYIYDFFLWSLILLMYFPYFLQ